MKTVAHPILKGLNAPQQQAVETVEGPVLILAGAGSGKTRALTHRIAHLMGQGVAPWQILAVTFTNRAATEMKERIRSLLHITEGIDLVEVGMGSGRMPTMGTFHSICARILRRDIEHLGRDRRFVIYDSSDQETLMKKVLKAMNIDEKELKPRAALGYIGRFKSEAMSPKEAAVQATTARMQHVIRAYERYQAALREANALDFDDLILETVRLFHEVPDVLARYQNTWKYLHVDEYQDTNHAQYLFISLLAEKHRNLCVIGDPDQSIYAFRGADIRNILEFTHEYPNALRIKLEQNYRSTQPILTAANAIIAANPNRPEKEMWTERKDGPQVVVHEVRDERREAEEVVKQADLMRASGTPLKDQAILYRTNAQSRLFEEACLRAGIPYRIVGGVKFYARKEVKDVLAYLYAILNPHDTLSLLRILNVPARKIGTTTLEHLQVFSVREKLPLWETLQNADDVPGLQESVRARILTFVSLLEKYRALSHQQPVSALTVSLLEDIGMEKWLRDDTEEGETRWENVQELLSVMHKYDALDAQTSLTSFLEEVALISEVDSLTGNKDDALTLMTLHLCKGLEFEHVMVAGCEEGIFPHSSSMFDKEQLEEERRLMYVGMTRAKTQLRIFFAQSRMLWGSVQANAPSRFLDDLPDAVTERRSDDVLSAFAWATTRAQKNLGAALDEPIVHTEERAHASIGDIEFNQDIVFEEKPTDEGAFQEGVRIMHPSFGTGTVVSRRGDVVDIRFDNGSKKSFALSIAPLKLL
ncbi:MAG: UvrD-helicase domain-containing protein [Candidatus Peregrinibacteria bacterium]|nr:UvrD-helicase domain-containing protein [Candidatus Peregrinibacteria bacterium]